MIVYKLVIFMLFISVHQCRVPDKVLCVNEQCNLPISKAKTLLGYNSVDNDLISFRANAEALIFMKSAGTNPDLWLAQIDGKTGFVSNKFLRETKIIEKNPQHVMPVGALRETKPEVQPEVKPDKVQQGYEVVDGTTIYTGEPAVENSATTPTPNEQQSTTPLSTAEDSNAGSKTVERVPSTTKPQEEIPVTPQASTEAPVTTPKPLENDLSKEELNIPVVTQPTTPEPHLESSTNVPIVTQQSPPADQVLVTTERSTEQSTTENVSDNEKVIPEQVNKELPESLPTAQPLSSISDVPLKVPETVENSQPSLINSKETVLPSDNIKLNESTETESNITTLPQIPEETVNNVLEEIKKPETIENKPNTSPEKIDKPNTPLQTTDKDGSFGISFDQEGNINYSSANQVDPEKVQNLTKEDNSPSNSENTTQISENTVKIQSSESTTQVPENTDHIQSTTERVIEAKFQSDTLPTETPTTQSTESPIIPDPTTKTTEVPAFDTFSYWTTETPSQNTEVPDITERTTKSTEGYPTDIYSTTTESSTMSESVAEPDYSYTPSYNDYSPEETMNMGTESPVDTAAEEDDEEEGGLSKMFTAFTNLWPSTTESPALETVFSESEVPQIAQVENMSDVKEDDGFSFTSYLISTYSSLMGSITNDETKALFASPGETCYSDEYCDGAATRTYNRFLMFLLTTASSVLLFVLGYYYIDNRRQDAKFIGNINALQRDLLFSQKECEILKEELSSTKTKLVGIEDNRFGMDDMVQSLKEEINEAKAQNERLRHSLDDNEKLLRVSENTAMELQNTLGVVDNTFRELLAERASADEQIAELNGKIQAFEEELISVTRERDNFQLKYVSAETALEELKNQKSQLEELTQQLQEAKSTIDLQRHEIVALKDAMKEIKGGSGNINVGSLIEHTEIKAQLAKALEERKNFEAKYEVELKDRSRISEELSTALETLRITTTQANEATTRLEVLGNYFKEREGELMKELSAKESLWLSKQGESASTVEKMELLQQEIQRFKEKCDALTLELAEQESSRRTAIAEVEARAHTAWLEARAAKREVDAARDDAAALRRKLASMTVADGAASPHRQVSSPLEATDGVLPPPLPLLPFLPPPLLPPLPRPPPLGRLPSPHPPRYNERRYSPDSRYSPSSRYSPQSRYSPETVRYSADSRYSPRRRTPSPYSRRRRSRSRERYNGSRPRNGPPDTETEYNSDASPPRYSRRSGPSSGSGCSTESDEK